MYGSSRVRETGLGSLVFGVVVLAVLHFFLGLFLTENEIIDAGARMWLFNQPPEGSEVRIFGAFLFPLFFYAVLAMLLWLFFF